MGRGLSYIQKAILLQIFEVLEAAQGFDSPERSRNEYSQYSWERTEEFEVFTHPLFTWKNRESIYLRGYKLCNGKPHGHNLEEQKLTSRSLQRLKTRGLVRLYYPYPDRPRKRITTRWVLLSSEGEEVAKQLQQNGFDRFLLDERAEIEKFYFENFRGWNQGSEGEGCNDSEGN